MTLLINSAQGHCQSDNACPETTSTLKAFGVSRLGEQDNDCNMTSFVRVVLNTNARYVLEAPNEECTLHTWRSGSLDNHPDCQTCRAA